MFTPFSESDLHDPNQPPKFFLVARCLYNTVNPKTFIKKMGEFWSNKCRFEVVVSEMHSDIFLLTLACAGDKQRISSGEPWNFFNQLILLHFPTSLQNISKEDFQFAEFWVQTHRLPFLSKSRALAKKVGEWVGEFIEVYEDSFHEGWGSLLRIRVHLDVSQPLMCGKMVSLPRVMDEHWLEFRYENLLVFYFYCGKIGHPFDKCIAFMELVDMGVDPDLLYGPQMIGDKLQFDMSDINASANDQSLNPLLQNIADCAAALQKWHHNKYGSMGRDIAAAHRNSAQLHNVKSSASDHIQQMENADRILDELLEKEELYWHQRARVDWLQSLRWKIGTGANVRCASNPWLPGNTTMTPYFYTGDPSFMVEHYISIHRTWDLRILQTHFGDIDIQRILSIPLSPFPRDDKLIWHHSDSGIYSVKIGYQLAASLETQHEHSSSSTHRQWWNRMWSLRLPKKLKIFLWRFINEALPTAVNLVHRKFSSSNACSLCQCSWKTSGHAIFRCKRAKAVWQQFQYKIHMPNMGNAKGFDIFSYIAAAHNDFELEQIVCLMWSIWSERNKEIHGTKPKPVAVLCSYSASYLAQFHKATTPKHAAAGVSSQAEFSTPPPVLVATRNPQTWRSPLAVCIN
uniref:Reverse transcriptase zinc-binding domain-containing protein n=1 Tax=Cannabis sativa TaxID=3483 RepID=A0A803PKZ1_CANSA